MKNIYLIPTDKPSRLFKNIHSNLWTIRKYYDEPLNKATQNQNIYITSDEDIKEWDWVIESDLKIITQAKFHYLEGLEGQFIDGIHISCWKKIILTTEQKLIRDGVQAIDDEFLKQFVKNPSCEFVEILKFADSRTTFVYKITTPQEETIEEAVKKYYENNIDASNIPREHYEIEIQDLMIGFASEWQLKHLNK